MQIAIMIEGQDGLNWPRWKRLVRHVEELGFDGLFRSDHFTQPVPIDKDALELWVSLTWLADHTQRMAFGPVVSPVSFRHPAHTARMAAAVDDLSGGRLVLGLGAGWQEREHAMYGFPLLEMGPRFKRFEEALEIISRLYRSDAPVSFQGEFYQLQEATLLPRPSRAGGPPILIGGNGARRTLPLAAIYADEWNAVFVPPHVFADLKKKLDGMLAAASRPAASVKRSLMQGLVFAPTDRALNEKLAMRKQDADELRGRGVLVGTPETIKEQLTPYEAAGVQRIMLQWLDLDDLDGLEALADTLLRGREPKPQP